MSAKDLEQRARELLAEAERGPMNDYGTVHRQIAHRAIVAALRQQPAPVDLEQFREAVDELLQFAEHDDSCGDHDSYNNASIPSCGCGLDGARERLLSIIDNAGKVECAEAEFADWLAKEMPAGTVIGDPAWWANRIARQYSKRAHQPAPVMDDARMARALEWVRVMAKVDTQGASEHLPAIEEAIAAYDPNCGARTVRVVDDANGWKTVPEEPTREMIDAGVMFGTSPNKACMIFQSMLNAAPSVAVVDDAMVKRAIVAYHDAGGAPSNTWAMRAALTAALASVQGGQP